MKRIVTITLMLLMVGSASAQQDWPTFKKNSQELYHYVADDQVTNFSFLLSSRSYIEYVKQQADSNFYYPLKAIWVKDRGSFYVLQPLPEQADSLRRSTLTSIQLLKNFYGDVQIDWLKFLFRSPLTDMADNLNAVFMNDTVSVTTLFPNEETINYERRTFTAGGQLGRIILDMKGMRAITTPYYQEVNKKWICIGWMSQVYREGEVTSGMQVSVQYSKSEEKIVPETVVTTIQNISEPDASSSITLYLKDFAFNEPFEVLDPDEQETPAN